MENLTWVLTVLAIVTTVVCAIRLTRRQGRDAPKLARSLL